MKIKDLDIFNKIKGLFTGDNVASLRGNVDFTLKTEQGEILVERHIRNLVVTTGLQYIADRLSDKAVTEMGWVAIGTGTDSPAAGNTALQTELVRVAASSITKTGAQVIYAATFPAGTAGAITEAGIFNAAVNGVMLARTTFSAIPKGLAESLVGSWTLTVAAG
jgi:hypothetical protein